MRSNINQLFYRDCARARAVNKDTSRDQHLQYPDGNHSSCCPDVPDCDLNNSDSRDNSSSEHKGSQGDVSTPTPVRPGRVMDLTPGHWATEG